jgi:hypothetical protein
MENMPDVTVSQKQKRVIAAEKTGRFTRNRREKRSEGGKQRDELKSQASKRDIAAKKNVADNKKEKRKREGKRWGDELGPLKKKTREELKKSKRRIPQKESKERAYSIRS